MKRLVNSFFLIPWLFLIFNALEAKDYISKDETGHYSIYFPSASELEKEIADLEEFLTDIKDDLNSVRKEIKKLRLELRKKE